MTTRASCRASSRSTDKRIGRGLKSVVAAAIAACSSTCGDFNNLTGVGGQADYVSVEAGPISAAAVTQGGLFFRGEWALPGPTMSVLVAGRSIEGTASIPPVRGDGHLAVFTELEFDSDEAAGLRAGFPAIGPVQLTITGSVEGHEIRVGGASVQRFTKTRYQHAAMLTDRSGTNHTIVWNLINPGGAGVVSYTAHQSRSTMEGLSGHGPPEAATVVWNLELSAFDATRARLELDRGVREGTRVTVEAYLTREGDLRMAVGRSAGPFASLFPSGTYEAAVAGRIQP